MKQFVNDAFAQDPRILQRRAEEKAQRCTPVLATYNTAVPCVRALPPQAALLCLCRATANLWLCLNREMLHTVHMYMSRWQE